MDLRGAVGFIVILDDDFAVADGLSGGGANGIVIIPVVMLAHAHVGQHPVNIGNGHRIGVNIAADDVAHLTQGFGINIAKQRQGFIGNIQRQLGLPGGAGLFFPFHALHQQHDKADADGAEDHRDADFRHNIQPQFGGRRPGHHQNHGHRFTDHPADNARPPVLLFGEFAVDPARHRARDDAGDKAGNSRHAADIDQVTVKPGDNASDNPHPGAKQDPA